MTYQAIANGARGLTYFGGHLTQIATPQDAELGWNWSFWEQTLRPIVRELAAPELQVALVAPDEKPGVKTATAGMELVTRRTTNYVFVIAVRSARTAARSRPAACSSSTSSTHCRRRSSRASRRSGSSRPAEARSRTGSRRTTRTSTASRCSPAGYGVAR
jgi:hypothetical protein